MEELNWGGISSAYRAGKLITAKEPFSLVIKGGAGDALKRVAAPGQKMDREMLGAFLSNFSLSALPGLMLYALGRHYRLDYEKLASEGVRMNFHIG